MMKMSQKMKQEIPSKLKSVQNQIAKTYLFAGQDHKQGVNHSGWPHAEQHRKTKTAHSEQIDHQVDPKRLGQSHLGEDAKGWNEQSNDDMEDDLREMIQGLEICQKALNEYLDMKKKIFRLIYLIPSKLSSFEWSRWISEIKILLRW